MIPGIEDIRNLATQLGDEYCRAAERKDYVKHKEIYQVGCLQAIIPCILTEIAIIHPEIVDDLKAILLRSIDGAKRQ